MKHFFEGWYYKHQNQTETVAFIPGFTHNKAFIQMVTNEKSYFFPYQLSECRKGKVIQIGSSTFSPEGITIHIHQNGNKIDGTIQYQHRTPIKGDIMGPFKLFPMQCRHGIISLHHKLYGSIHLNDREINFDHGTGYIECDSGHSFPKRYVWLQSNDFGETSSIMAAIADIPFIGTHFTGLICIIYLNGREYRLATYYGARIIRCCKHQVIIKQGRYRLEVNIANSDGHHLAAPCSGQMSKMIKENPSCCAHFRFYVDDNMIFNQKSSKTSFEFVK